MVAGASGAAWHLTSNAFASSAEVSLLQHPVLVERGSSAGSRSQCSRSSATTSCAPGPFELAGSAVVVTSAREKVDQASPLPLSPGAREREHAEFLWGQAVVAMHQLGRPLSPVNARPLVRPPSPLRAAGGISCDAALDAASPQNAPAPSPPKPVLPQSPEPPPEFPADAAPEPEALRTPAPAIESYIKADTLRSRLEVIAARKELPPAPLSLHKSSRSAG